MSTSNNWKFQDGLEAQLVREDKITKALLDRSVTSFNDVVRLWV